MGFLRVNSCCCGCTLEKGTRIIAYLGIFSGVIGLLGLFSAWVYGDRVVFVRSDAIATKFVGEVTTLVISCLLLHGCDHRKPAFILAWLIVDGIGLGLCCFIIPVYSVILIVAASKGVSAVVTGVIAFALVVVGLALTLAIYLFAVVYSFYCQLRERQQGNQLGVIALPVHQTDMAQQDPECGHPQQQQQQQQPYPQQCPPYQPPPSYDYKEEI